MDYHKITQKKLNTKSGLCLYLHGVVCAMNRFYKTGSSQAVFEMYNVDVARDRWTFKMIFDFISDSMLILGDEHHISYCKVLQYVFNHMSVYSNVFEEDL